MARGVATALLDLVDEGEQRALFVDFLLEEDCSFFSRESYDWLSWLNGVWLDWS